MLFLQSDWPRAFWSITCQTVFPGMQLLEEVTALLVLFFNTSSKTPFFGHFQPLLLILSVDNFSKKYGFVTYSPTWVPNNIL